MDILGCSTSEHIQDLSSKSKISKTIRATADNWMSVFNLWENVRSEQTQIWGLYSPGILHDKHHLTLPKIFEATSIRCLVSLFKFHLSKRKKLPVEINTINNILGKKVANSTLQNFFEKIDIYSAC